MRELTCIVCPLGCRIQVDDNLLRIEGNGCRRGELYARDEITAPKRMVTGIVAVKGSSQFLPVKTAAPVSKESIFKVMAEIRRIVANKPVFLGEVLRENIAGTGVALVATKSVH